MAIPDGQRRSYSGGAVQTTIAARITDTDTTLQVVDASTYPAGNGSPFAIVINRGKNNEEKIYVGNKAGNSFQNSIRGADGSQAFTHEVGEPVEHIHTALDANEANRHVTDDTQDDHGQYMHISVAREVSANHVFSGNTTHTGTTTFTGDIVSTGDFDLHTLTSDTVYGNPSFTGNPTFDNLGNAVITVGSATGTAGTSKVPMRSDARPTLDIKAIARAMTPAGSIRPYVGNALPADSVSAGEWLFPDGSVYSPTTYPALFAAISNTYGGTTSAPKLPDFRGKVLTGVDTAHAYGAAGGNLTKTLSFQELAPHNHSVTINDPGHAHAAPGNSSFIIGSTPASTLYTNAGSNVDHSPAYNVSANAATVTSTTGVTIPGGLTGTTGNAQAFNIEQPWAAVRYLIKVH